MTASVFDQNNASMSGVVVTWTSSNQAIATVSAQGLVTAVSYGTSQVTASAGNASAQIQVKVIQEAGSIVIEPAAATLMALGETVRLTANVLDQNGQPVAGAAVTWQSSDETVATVTAQGLVTAVSNGTAQITASAGSISASVTVKVMAVSREREALTSLYHATDGSNWTNNTNWLSDQPLGDWFGVHTDDRGEVVQLELRNNNLQGPIPPEIGILQRLSFLVLDANRLSGAIPPEIGQLQNLGSLYLGENQLSGAIPPEIGQLLNLTFLNLGNNRLSGAIPPEIGHLHNLTILSLGNNQLSGAIPPEIGQLGKLESLLLFSLPYVSGPMPDSLSNLTKLVQLALDHTPVCIPNTTIVRTWLDGIENTSGVVFCSNPERDALIALYDRTNGPNWTDDTNWSSSEALKDWYGVSIDADGGVTALNLADNNLSGTLPSQLSNLVSLRKLDLSLNTGLSGPVPLSYTGLGLEELSLNGTMICAPLITEFMDWLEDVTLRSVANCTETRLDYYALAELYNRTNGPAWNNSTNWLSDAPLDTWYGVRTNTGGKVTELDLSSNNLQGVFPPEIGKLQNLTYLALIDNQLRGNIPPEIAELQNLVHIQIVVNQLTGSIPSEIGQLQHLETLSLWGNKLTGSIPTEIGRLENLEHLSLASNALSESIPLGIFNLDRLSYINLTDNGLTGTIPPDVGQLRNLTELGLGGNQLTGTIPTEIGQLGKLEILQLWHNELTGNIPPDIGQLSNLTELGLGGNQLTGTIPTEIGQLKNLTSLRLLNNQIEGLIPPELGGLGNLRELRLNNNRLSGPVPPEIGSLHNAVDIDLSSNQLSGSIPPELGFLNTLENLHLSFNRLSGNIPDNFGNLTNLKSLRLSDNAGMSGPLPPELTRLDLDDLLLGGTMLCAPEDSEFQAWLRAVPNNRVARCLQATGRSTTYLTQATQSHEFPVPLVAGEDALLRVFVTTDADVNVNMPLVRATFFEDGAEVYAVDIPGHGSNIPEEIDEGDLSSSANARIPASVVVPGLEMVIEIDPDGALDPAMGIVSRLPRTGMMEVDVVDMPPFELTMVPFLWTENPDHVYLAQIESLTDESDLLRHTRDLLPVGDLELKVYEAQWISVDPGWDARDELIRITMMIRAMDGSSGHFMGMLRNGGGWGERPGTVSISVLEDDIIAHELGHNLGLYHVPCGGAAEPDPDYPYPGGSIGAWGYDILEEQLVNPGTADLMGYCRPRWISDYHFNKAMGYRLSQAQAARTVAIASSSRSLLLWGGVEEDGELVLEPSFVVDAPAAVPEMGGPYRVTGEDSDGGVLFDLPFGMPEIADGGRGAFAFILPARADWSRRLARITLSGPEGVATLDKEDEFNEEGETAAALLLDPYSGQVRGILRDWPGPEVTRPSARRVLPEPGLKVVVSGGIPEDSDWNR